jgi:hypothetical protein
MIVASCSSSHAQCEACSAAAADVLFITLQHSGCVLVVYTTPAEMCSKGHVMHITASHTAMSELLLIYQWQHTNSHLSPTITTATTTDPTTVTIALHAQHQHINSPLPHTNTITTTALHCMHRVIHCTHPQFTPAGERAQKNVPLLLNGKRGLWFCGAWMGYGFHEDGLRSGLEIAVAITGKPVPWAPAATAACVCNALLAVTVL